MPKRWNGVSERERFRAQRQKWAHNKAATREDHISDYDQLQGKHAQVDASIKESLAKQRELDVQIKDMRQELKLNPTHADLKYKVSALVQERVLEEASRRELREHKRSLDDQVAKLKEGPLNGTRLNGRRASRPLVASGSGGITQEFHDSAPWQEVNDGEAEEFDVSFAPPLDPSLDFYVCDGQACHSCFE